MVFSEVMRELQNRNVYPTESAVRWAIRTGRVSRPPLDGALRFDFDEKHVAELAAYFAERETATA